jgi:hypothetical protein
MPWMAAAAVSSAVIGGVVSNNASKKAANAAEENRRIAEQARQDALRLNQPLYDFGLGSIPELLAHYGGATGPTGAPAGPAPAGGGPSMQNILANPMVGSDDYWDDYGESYGDLQAEWARIAGKDKRFAQDDDYYEWHYNNYGKNEDRALPTYGTPQTQPAPAGPVTPGPTDATGAPAPAPTSAAGAAQVYGPQLTSRPEIAARPVVNRRPEIARPDILSQPAPTFTMPTRTRETLEAPTRAPVPTFERREVTPFSFTEAEYRESPGYQHVLKEGNRNILANLGITGGIESGDALRGIAEFGQGLADQDWDDERAFAYGVWGDNTNRMDRLDSEDMGYTYDNYWKGWGADFDAYRYGQDRLDDSYEFDVTSDRANQRQSYDIFADQRDFAAGDYWKAVARNDGLDEFDITRSDRNHDKDTALEQDLYTIDRGYLTDRWDQKTDDLFRRLGIGQGAAGAITGAGQNYVNTVSGANDSAAGAKGNAALIGASNTNDLLEQLVKVLGSGGSKGSGSSDTDWVKKMTEGWG